MWVVRIGEEEESVLLRETAAVVDDVCMYGCVDEWMC